MWMRMDEERVKEEETGGSGWRVEGGREGRESRRVELESREEENRTCWNGLFCSLFGVRKAIF